MYLLRWSVHIHKWFARFFGNQILLWIARGPVMSDIPIVRVCGQHKIAAASPASIAPAELTSLQDVANRLQVDENSEASLSRVLLGGRVSGHRSELGRTPCPVNETLARHITEANFAGIGSGLKPFPIRHLNMVGLVRFGARSLMIATPRRCISTRPPQKCAHRSSTWRFYDFFCKLHFINYDDGADFSHPLLITAAGAALFVAFSGSVLFIIKIHRTLIVRRRRVAQISACSLLAVFL